MKKLAFHNHFCWRFYERDLTNFIFLL